MMGEKQHLLPHPFPLPLPLPVSAAVRSGSLHTDDSWRFLQRFCFAAAGGHLNITLRESANRAGTASQEIAFYFDAYATFQRAYSDPSLTCDERKHLAEHWESVSSIEHDYVGGTASFTVGAVIPRWWFVAVVNCYGGPGGTPSGIDLDSWEIHFTNQPGMFTYEFSYDVQGIPEMNIVFFMLYSTLLIVLAWNKRHAKEKGMQYTVTKYLFVSVLVDCIAFIFNLAHYCKFAQDGIGITPLEGAFFFVDLMSSLILLYIVLMLCHGWTISTNFVQSKRLIIVIISTLFLLYIALFVWSEYLMDPASVLHRYETPPGWTIVGARVALVLYGIVSLAHTWWLEREERKRQFYILWAFIAGIWLLTLPIIALVAHFCIETWRRRVCVFGVEHTVQSCMFLILTYLFRPFRSNRYIQILKPDESRAFGKNNMQIFPAALVESGNAAVSTEEVQFSTI